MDRCAHIIYVPFTGVGVGVRDDEWLQKRILIFGKYTLNSLLNQTNRNFMLWLSFRPEDKENPKVRALQNLLEGRFPVAFTFDGLMYWDDKFGGGMLLVKNVGRVVRRFLRTKDWQEMKHSLPMLLRNKNKTLKERLARSLQKLVLPKDVRWVYLTRIDSDDMFHRYAVEEIQAVAPRLNMAIIYQNGYLYRKSTDELAEYNPTTNPPFHTIVFPSWIFFDAGSHLWYYGKFRSHEDVTKVFSPLVLLPGRHYCVVNHDEKNHISNVWSHPFKGELIEDSKMKKDILLNFGIGVY